ncbi:hypothetical protein CALCODRAFT_153693 [Calocera cornea HHB12733]|uniref:Uncharacterized protein n=1 Tax=Calocera cornea HHB12733 TaxID=1353952 RepID=A0A165CMQ5_9BASI|nr:hypothetical protein CALCODRAFT_153693 [Calocera cornea HHB12733]
MAPPPPPPPLTRRLASPPPLGTRRPPRALDNPPPSPSGGRHVPRPGSVVPFLLFFLTSALWPVSCLANLAASPASVHCPLSIDCFASYSDRPRPSPNRPPQAPPAGPEQPRALFPRRGWPVRAHSAPASSRRASILRLSAEDRRTVAPGWWCIGQSDAARVRSYCYCCICTCTAIGGRQAAGCSLGQDLPTPLCPSPACPYRAADWLAPSSSSCEATRCASDGRCCDRKSTDWPTGCRHKSPEWHTTFPMGNE